MKKLLASLLALLLIASLCACSEEQGNEDDWGDNFQQNDEKVDHINTGNAYNEVFYFEAIDTETVTITGYQAVDAPHVMKIPETLDGKAVVAISERAFYFCSKINGVEFPSTLTEIGKEAFAGCSLIESLTVPAQITSIGELAFYGCSALKTLTFAEGCAAKIGQSAFMDCNALKAVTIPGTVKTVAAGAFFECLALEEAEPTFDQPTLAKPTLEEPVRHMTVYPKLKEPESSYPENPYKPNPGYIDLTE